MRRGTLVLALVLGLALGSPLLAAAPWENLMGRADYLMGIGRYVEARAVFQDITYQYPATPAVDRAVVGIAKSYLAEEDYRAGVSYLEDVLTKSGDLESRKEARELYGNLERSFRAARVSATQARDAKQAEYDDISWWNIFKIFTKLGLRSDLKDAEKDLNEIASIHNMFNPNLLMPDAYADTGTADETTDETTDDTAASDTASEGATDETTSTEDMDRARAYDILKDDIARLIALVPDEKQDEVSDIVSAAGTTPTSDEAVIDTDDSTDDAAAEAAGEDEGTTDETDELVTDDTAGSPDDTAVVGSELTTDTSDEVGSDDEAAVEVAADETDETTGVVEVIGTGDEVAAIDETATTTESVAAEDETSAEVAVAETTDVVVEDAAPAAPSMTVGELRQAYVNAYQVYIRAHQSGDPAQIQEALAAYRTSLQAFNEAQTSYRNVQVNGPADAPSAASTTETPAVKTPVPAVPAGVVVPTDRLGRVTSGGLDSGIRSSRGGLQR